MKPKLVLACFVIVILATFLTVNAENLELNNCKVVSIKADQSSNSYNFTINSSYISKNLISFIPIYASDTPELLAFKEAQFDLLSDAYFHERSLTIEGTLVSGKFEIRRVSIGNYSIDNSSGCNAGLTKCAKDCADLRSDVKNCGACGHICPAGNTCQDGACTGCVIGLTKCAKDCADLRSDVKNCGACGHICPAGKTCKNGACVG